MALDTWRVAAQITAHGGNLFGFGEAAKKPELHGARIEDYAVIGDLQTSALVSREGSIDWLCWPAFSSGACFAGLLGTSENGFWKIFPQSKNVKCARNYQAHTLILESVFSTDEGEVKLIDFMPPRGEHSDVIRIVEGLSGKVKMRMDLVLRFDYGLTIPWVTTHDDELIAIAGPNMVVLRKECEEGLTADLRGEGLTTVSEFVLKQGERVCFALTYTDAAKIQPPPRVLIDKELEDTQKFWCEWAAKNTIKGQYGDTVERSLIVLKSLSYKPTGGMVAAVTTSLPEAVGGERNWDYRFCWLRDTAFALLVLIQSGYTDEALGWRNWLLRAIAGAPDQVQTMYSIFGERKLLEWSVDWLAGYENSRPVRVGNAAAEQFQLDVFGEVAVALSRMPESDDELSVSAHGLEAALIDHVCHIWNQPDDGIWEVRGKRQHFVHSKVMAWVALDRAIQNHEKYDGKGDVKRWRKNRSMLHKEICEKGFDKKLNSFTQAYGSKSIDASLLRLLFVGFLPLDDPRIRGTVNAVEKYLIQDGLVLRYDTERSADGLHGREGTFLACSFWLSTCWWLLGEHEKSREMFERLLALQNDVGLLSEEYDTKNHRMLGNFPQALSHIALIHTAITISGRWKPQPYNPNT